MVPIGANPIISMWGERSIFSMVLVGHRSVKREKKDATKFRNKNELYRCKNGLIGSAVQQTLEITCRYWMEKSFITYSETFYLVDKTEL